MELELMALENPILFSCHHEQKTSLGNAQNTVKLDGDAGILEDTSFWKTEFTAHCFSLGEQLQV